MIDWTRVAELRAEVGADAFDEVADMFLAEIAEAAARLTDPGAGTPAEALHYLKGAALNLGFEEVSAACERAEAAIAGGADPDRSVAEVLARLDASRTAFVEGRAAGRHAA